MRSLPIYIARWVLEAVAALLGLSLLVAAAGTAAWLGSWLALEFAELILGH